jgi:hypothetical protein
MIAKLKLSTIVTLILGVVVVEIGFITPLILNPNTCS